MTTATDDTAPRHATDPASTFDSTVDPAAGPATDPAVDLAARALGGAVLAANDESFAEKEHLIEPYPVTHRPRTFGPNGQRYDGWETRRRRDHGHDWAVVRLGLPGRIHHVTVDTAHFTGNHPPRVSLDACRIDGHPALTALLDADWHTLLPPTEAAGDTANHYPVHATGRYTHVRLNLHPDGGVARLRVHG
ncbi:hypothetical protein E9998_02045, partial [Glycomyces paridis]